MEEESNKNVNKTYTDPETGKFIPGNPGGGRPKGSISVIGKIKKKFEENPEYFDEWVDELLKDAGNRRAVMEQIDGRPKQSVDMDIKLPQTLIDIIKHGATDEG